MQKESSSGCANSSAEQRQQAEAATAVFPPRKDVQKRHDWMVMYKALVAFGEKNGHCNVPLRHPRVMVNETDSAHLGIYGSMTRIKTSQSTKFTALLLLQLVATTPSHVLLEVPHGLHSIQRR